MIYTKLNVLTDVQCDQLFERVKRLDWKFHHDDVYQKLEHRDLKIPELKDILEAVGLGDRKVLRAKFNLCLRRDKRVESWHHVDSDKPHTVVLYYLHDTDGDTILKSGLKYKPKRNTAFVFDGSNEHYYIYPQENDFRINLNIDLEDALH